MLHDVLERPGAATPAELRAAYERRLGGVVADRGVEAVAAESGVDESTVAALAAIGDGSHPHPGDDEDAAADARRRAEVTVEEAAAILATESGTDLTADDVVFALRDHLMMGMTTGVLDVDTIASNVALDLSGQEIQQAIEGRAPMTLAQLAAIQRYVAARNDPDQDA
jgi:hypothetical protein